MGATRHAVLGLGRIQRRLPPSAYTAEAGPVTVAGWLEPGQDVGGDTFDYPGPFLMREGAVVPLELATQLPLGLASDPYRTDVFVLSPGDRLLLVTDGYLDRLAARLDIAGTLTRTPERHPRQIVQELAQGVLGITGGKLRDATVWAVRGVVVPWLRARRGHTLVGCRGVGATGQCRRLTAVRDCRRGGS